MGVDPASLAVDSAGPCELFERVPSSTGARAARLEAGTAGDQARQLPGKVSPLAPVVRRHRTPSSPNVKLAPGSHVQLDVVLSPTLAPEETCASDPLPLSPFASPLFRLSQPAVPALSTCAGPKSQESTPLPWALASISRTFSKC